MLVPSNKNAVLATWRVPCGEGINSQEELAQSSERAILKMEMPF
jgi:hypothetical protein